MGPLNSLKSIVFGIFLVSALPSHANPSQHLESILEPISLGERFTADHIPIISSKLVTKVYQVRQYQLLWTDTAYASTMLDVLKRADDEGLFKEDYHYPYLSQLHEQLVQKQWQDEGQRALFDVLLSDGIISYAIHMLNGKVNPSMLGKTWNYDETAIDFDATIKLLETHIEQHTVADAIAKLSPPFAPYRELKQHLATYKALAQQYPFTTIVNSQVIKPGNVTPNVTPILAAIAKRLTQEGYLPLSSSAVPSLSDTSQATTYDGELEAAVKTFQQTHSLKPDGVIGKETMAALNVSYEARADQIRINLERARWLSANLKPDYLVVNLAGYELLLFKDNQLSWRTDIIIGKINTQTPLFKSKLKYVVVNPTWTVPRSISKEIINHLKSDPQYMEKKHFSLVESSGAPVTVHNIDWQTVNANKFPYWFVQQPGPDNALGQVKFIFPNQYAIYLHDTPSKSLFQHANRAFSHGCIRVKDPLVLADKLLSEREDWTFESLNNKLATGKTENLFLKQPLDILIMYWTASSNNGKITFYNDIYQRDPQLVDALKHQTYEAVNDLDGRIKIM